MWLETAFERHTVPGPVPAVGANGWRAPWARGGDGWAAKHYDHADPTIDLARSADVRRITPRQMSQLSMELYLSGVLDRQDHALLSFQPELHPDYDRTIGSLIGQKAAPDLPKDFVRLWEERLHFTRSHGPIDSKRHAQVKRILGVLRQLASER